MRIRQDIDSILFFKAIQTCKGDVQFLSRQGDVLNLKSTLSQYLFTFLWARKDVWENGQINCENPQDVERLRDFLWEDDTNE